jgi:hypothetical protein
MTTIITPTFILKGINPTSVLQDYERGFFTRPIQKKQKITILQNSLILSSNYSSSSNDGIFAIKDKNNSTVIFACTGHSDFEIFNTTGENIIGGRCEFCRDDFTNAAVGCPLAYKENMVLTNSDGNKPIYKIYYSFWVEGRFCTFECALAYIQNILNKPSVNRDTTMRDSEKLLKSLYKLIHPESTSLRPSQEPRLLKVNGGSLTREEWSDKKHIFKRTDRVHMIPAKVEYVRADFNEKI